MRGGGGDARHGALTDEDHAAGAGGGGMQKVALVGEHDDGVESSRPNLVLSHFAEAIYRMRQSKPGGDVGRGGGVRW